MAKYTINHECGHTAVARLFGPGKERERKIEWLSGRECEDCYRARVEHQMRNEQSSRWWIDHRSESVAGLTRAEHARITCCNAK